MANDYRNESRRQPPADRYGTPGTYYPTANPYDLVITEDAGQRANVFEPVIYGTPHPTVTTALLCHQGAIKGNAQDKGYVRVYANPRLAQEPYNLVTGDADADDKNFLSFVRSYLLPRGYTKATRGVPLTALIGLTLVSGGTGYAAANVSPGYGKIALAFAGGGGSGAAGFAECAAGIIVSVVLTNTGTGYTSAPTVSVSGGSGASITALLQPDHAMLFSEEETPAEEPFAGFFVRVTRTYKPLPGATLTATGINPEANGEITETTTQDLATGAADYVPDYKTLSWTDTPINSVAKKRTVVSLPADEDFPILTEYEQDPVLQYLIVTTYQIVDALSVVSPTVSNGIIKSFKKIDKWRSLKIVEDHTALLAVEYDEQRFDSANFPTLFDYTQYENTDACGVFSTERDGFSAMVQSRVNVTFNDMVDTITGLTLIPKSLHLGRGAQISGVLVDAGSFTYVGTCTGTVSFGASSPSYSTYIGSIQDTEQLITGESVLFRAGIYRTTKLYRTMK